MNTVSPETTVVDPSDGVSACCAYHARTLVCMPGVQLNTHWRFCTWVWQAVLHHRGLDSLALPTRLPLHGPYYQVTQHKKLKLTAVRSLGKNIFVE